MRTILLHAFPLDGTMWSQIDGEALDYPGRGSLAGWADLVAERIDGRAFVCGLSMGGYAAFELAHRHPERLAGLVLADTRPGADSAEQRAARDANIELVRREGAAALWQRVAPTLLRADAEATALEQARAICERQPPGRLIAMLEALRDRADRSDVLAAIAVPTVVVCGSDDAVTPPAPTRAWAERIDAARYVEIPAAGHLSVLEQPAAFRAALELLADD